MNTDDRIYELVGFSGSISFTPTISRPKQVIRSGPATIVIWDDGTKTVVKCHDMAEYDSVKGFLLCVMKKAYGNDNSYKKLIDWGQDE